jgi:hypothetical protein
VRCIEVVGGRAISQGGHGRGYDWRGHSVVGPAARAGDAIMRAA